MITVLIGALLNILLDPIFIYSLDMGCRGAALATIISQVTSALWIFAFFLGKRTILRFRKKYLKLDLSELGPVVLLGLSPFFVQLTEFAIPLIMNAGMQRYGNDYYVGTMTILFSISLLIHMPVDGLCQGAVPIMSYNYGAGRPDRVKHTCFLIIRCSFAYAAFGSGLIMLFPELFILPFTDSPEILTIATHGARLYFAGMMSVGVLYACQRTFMALGRPKLSLLGAVMRKCVILIPLALLLPRFFGTDGLFYAEIIADTLGSGIVIAIFCFHFKMMLQPQ